MSKVITFSQKFPSYHPKKGQPTYFVEKILNDLGVDYNDEAYLKELFKLNEKNIELSKLSYDDIELWWLSLNEKILITNETKAHTIRNSKRIKAGDIASFRVWSGKPYNSPQIIFYKFKIIKTFDFKMDLCGVYSINGMYTENDEPLAINDGFDNEDDLFNWLMPNYDKPTEINGQIICWNPTIIY